MSKDSTKKALDNYLKKQLKSDMQTIYKKPNGQPEKEFVKILMKYLEQQGFSCHVVESKAVWNPKANRYISGQAEKGFPDICGCGPEGQSVWIEAKAQDRRNTLRPEQREFLEKKLEMGCFAIVCDKIEFFDFAWKKWQTAPTYLEKVNFLKNCLPQKRDTGNKGVLF